ncbi:sporulation protein YqfD [Sporolactobacillus vineae]|uniref:sporulation protein YqfD n=1 Tax=Sporolactobacillus vineae TaxID=444463 RepID=UPI0002880BA5|nr:sporulation protein YqfD [Sporolactobacillus vineae]
MSRKIRTGPAGWLKAEITGEQTEQFIRLCVAEKIVLWSVRRTGENKIVCSFGLTTPLRLKRILKTSGCRMRILERNGISFFWKKLRRRSGIVAGLFLFLAVMIFMSNMVWSVQVNGADPKLEDQIRKLLKNEHVYPGATDFFISDPGAIESRLSAKLNTVTWIGVSREGTTYKIDVVQKKYPKPAKKTGPRNLIAAKPAMINRLFVETGQPVVESNQYVRRGQLLVLGQIGTEEKPRFVSSKGYVIGETWYQSETKIPLRNKMTLFTGKTATSVSIHLGQAALPIWGFTGHAYRHAETETVRKPVRFLIWALPVTYDRTIYRETKQVTRVLTRQQGLEEASREADRVLLSRLRAGSKIISSTIEKSGVKNNILTISSRQVVNENIAVPQAINTTRKPSGKK